MARFTRLPVGARHALLFLGLAASGGVAIFLAACGGIALLLAACGGGAPGGAATRRPSLRPGPRPSS